MGFRARVRARVRARARVRVRARARVRCLRHACAQFACISCEASLTGTWLG